MSEFIQLHLLTSFPPSNINRDDLGRPKTAKMGGYERLRISSQSLKRHWRTSDIFESALAGHIGVRTKRLGCEVLERLKGGGVSEKNALTWANEIAKVFGKPKKDSVELEQLSHCSPAERNAVFDLTAMLIAENRPPQDEELDLLKRENMAVDIALFGRMLASKADYNVEAACQVAHALSVHSVIVESDYFTAIDDLNRADEQGSSHIGESGFAAALFYSYICINRTQLVDNLGGDVELADKAIRALTEAAAKVAPSGKQNSFASRAYASFILAEKGDQQPRSLSVSYLKPINGDDYIQDSIAALLTQRDNFDKAYDQCANSRYALNAYQGDGTLSELLDFVAS